MEFRFEAEKSVQSPRRSAWPDALAYREAIQSPENLAAPELRGAVVDVDRHGLPLAYSGRCAVAFPVRAGGARWAVRCFTTAESPADLPREVRYGLLARCLPALGDAVVPFRYVPRGVRLGTRWYPSLTMQWAEGVPLGLWVAQNADRPDALRRLAATLRGTLGRLEAAGIAHGDWQHDNLLVSEGGARVTLVDYDGLFVPELAGHLSPELGHANYQHPARTPAHFGVGLDRFACQALRAALLALAADPPLWARFGGEDAVLFRASDFRDPDGSPLFSALLSSLDATVRREAGALAAACRDPSGWLPEPATALPLSLARLRQRLDARVRPEPAARSAAEPHAGHNAWRADTLFLKRERANLNAVVWSIVPCLGAAVAGAMVYDQAVHGKQNFAEALAEQRYQYGGGYYRVTHIPPVDERAHGLTLLAILAAGLLLPLLVGWALWPRHRVARRLWRNGRRVCQLPNTTLFAFLGRLWRYLRSGT